MAMSSFSSVVISCVILSRTIGAHADVNLLQTKAFSELLTRLDTGDTSLLAEMHAATSGLKVLVTTTAIHDLETACRSMGGHGFSEFAGVGKLYAEYVPAATCVFLYLNGSTYSD